MDIKDDAKKLIIGRPENGEASFWWDKWSEQGGSWDVNKLREVLAEDILQLYLLLTSSRMIFLS